MVINYKKLSAWCNLSKPIIHDILHRNTPPLSKQTVYSPEKLSILDRLLFGFGQLWHGINHEFQKRIFQFDRNEIIAYQHVIGGVAREHELLENN